MRWIARAARRILHTDTWTICITRFSFESTVFSRDLSRLPGRAGNLAGAAAHAGPFLADRAQQASNGSCLLAGGRRRNSGPKRSLSHRRDAKIALASRI